MNKNAKYYSEVGSYRGAIKIGGKWISAHEMHRTDKRGWERWQGPPSRAIINAMQEQPIIFLRDE